MMFRKARAVDCENQGKGWARGNVTLQRELGWSEDSYWPIRDRLVDAGLLELGRGRGGSVSLVIQAAPLQSDTFEPPSSLYLSLHRCECRKLIYTIRLQKY